MERDIRSMTDFYNDIAQEFSEEWYANDSLLPTLKHFISSLVSNPRVLDLGCGAGYESMRLHQLGASVVGIDISEEPIKIARQRNPDCCFHIMDFRTLISSIGTFDGVAAIASLIHIQDSELTSVFQNIANVLNPGGYLMLAVIEGEGISLEKSFIERNGKKYNRKFYLHQSYRLNEAAAEAGFSFSEELALPDELASYGWKCFLYHKNVPK